MSGPASGGVTPARTLEATVVGIDKATYRVTVKYNHVPGGAPDVRLTSMYSHAAEGEGGDIFPEIGANCYVGFPSEPDGRPYILAYVMPPTNIAGDQGTRGEKNGGDFVFSTRDGNTVALRRGGLVQISASPLCQRFYVPVGNIIRDLFAQREDVSLLGRMEWVHGETGSGSKTKATYRLELKDAVEDTFPTVELEVSSERTDLMPLYVNTEFDIPDPFIPTPSHLRLKVTDATGSMQVFTFQVNRAGDTHLYVRGYMLVRSEGVMRFVPGSAFEIIGLAWKSKTDILGRRTEEFVSSATRCLTTLQLLAPSISIEGLTSLGGPGATDGAVKGNLIAWLLELVVVLDSYGIKVRPPPPECVSTVVKVL